MKNLIPTMLVIVITIISCNPSEPENNRELTLKVEDVSCIEAWINIQMNNISLPAQINVTANSQPVNQLTLTTSDSLIVIDSLQPNSIYTFQATMSNNITSKSVSTLTMDTTSHEFNWQIFEFGEHSSSVLQDIAVIDENNIWAVGEIYLEDTTGGSGLHNAIQWDGNEWEIKKVIVNYKGNLTIAPLLGIFALGPDEIILTSGVPYLPDGNGNWKLYHLWDIGVFDQDDGGVTKIWGRSLNNLYFVGRSGSIAHYNGSSWQKIESGTELDIYDIWGGLNEDKNEYEICAAAAKLFVNFNKEVLRITNYSAELLPTIGIPHSIHGIWFIPQRNYYVAGSGLYSKNELESSESWKSEHTGITNNYLYAIRGQGLNDIVACGAFGEVLHYNGIRWRSIKEMSGIPSSALLLNIDIKGNTIVIAGIDNPKGFVAIGRR